MKTPNSRFSRIILSLMLLIVIAGIIAYLVLPRPEQRQIVLMGGALLILNLVLMQFFLGKNL